jgi:hypothetical protein
MNISDRTSPKTLPLRTKLNEVIGRRSPELMTLVQASLERDLTNEERSELAQIVTDEFSQFGLREDSEPNAYGLEMEDLIDFVLGDPA